MSNNLFVFKHWLTKLLLLTIALVGISLALVQIQTSAQQNINNTNLINDNGLIVKLKSAENLGDIKSKLENAINPSTANNISNTEVQTLNQANDSNLVLLDQFEGKTYAEIEATLKQLPEVDFVQPNYPYIPVYAPTDPAFATSQWHLRNQQYATYTESAWDSVGDDAGIPTCSVSTQLCGGSPDVVVAVIDTGVQQTISEFAGTNFVSPAAFEYASACSSPTEIVDNVAGQFLCRKNAQDDLSNSCSGTNYGHGTQVASIIGMNNNGAGGVGLAYNTSIMPISIKCAFNTYGVAKAIEYARINGAEVVNMSIGTPYNDNAVYSEILNAYNAGVVMVASSGNCGNAIAQSASCFPFLNPGQPSYGVFNPPVYPAYYSQVISVGATTQAGARATFSTYNTQVDLAAPGASIYVATNTGGTQTSSGTSFASPMVAAAAALLKSVDPNVNSKAVENIIRWRASDMLSAGYDTETGFGALNVNNLINYNPNVSPISVTSDINTNGRYSQFVRNSNGGTFEYSLSGGPWISTSNSENFIADSDNSIGLLPDGQWLNVFYTRNNNIYYKYSFDRSSWSAESQVNGASTAISPAPLNHLGFYNLFYIGLDNRIYHKYFAGGSWSAANQVIDNANNVSNIFAIPEREWINVYYQKGNNIFHSYTNNGNWSTPSQVPLVASSRKIIVTNHLGFYNMFYIGLDNSLYHTYLGGNGWAGNRLIINANASEVSAFVDGSYINLFWIEGGRLKQSYTNNGVWAPATNII